MISDIPPRLLEQARFQAGVVARRQAIQAGMSKNGITSKVKSGRWRHIYSGVYATFTGPITRGARLWAVVLYAGRGAQLSYETAAEVLRLTDERSALIHVTIPAERRVRSVTGVVIHRSTTLETGWRFARGIPPHTWIEETITDLVDAAANFDDAVGWITAGFQRKLTGEARLKAVMAGRKKLRWRDLLEEVIPMAAAGTHSTLEYRYDRDVERAHGLPPARRQVPFVKADGSRGYRDRCYDQYGLVVELDGKRFHGGDYSHRDRRRDNDATVTTGATLRYGWDDVARTPCETAAQLFAALRARGYRGAVKPCSAVCTALPLNRIPAPASPASPASPVAPPKPAAPVSSVATAALTAGTTLTRPATLTALAKSATPAALA
ncbi:hypothetical protein EAS64_34400 [Trebonia kvetii]|uniref:Type IV toxin-antitoxin system AbiEi family antitoxin domain-containing protein n=1 Tax=Trebonia kvetii TaxID=2480626 RepID=A0A6P2BQW8_9ACTN|nr:hypothetical protein [Trebonia kvetii]TVZ01360.1 hypothetical protein EAS64_34400 [Trebonia kvetii]